MLGIFGEEVDSDLLLARIDTAVDEVERLNSNNNDPNYKPA